MIVHVTNIEWDIEDDTHIEELPKEVDLEYDDLCISFLRDMADFVKDLKKNMDSVWLILP